MRLRVCSVCRRLFASARGVKRNELGRTNAKASSHRGTSRASNLGTTTVYLQTVRKSGRLRQSRTLLLDPFPGPLKHIHSHVCSGSVQANHPKEKTHKSCPPGEAQHAVSRTKCVHRWFDAKSSRDYSSGFPKTRGCQAFPPRAMTHSIQSADAVPCSMVLISSPGFVPRLYPMLSKVTG